MSIWKRIWITLKEIDSPAKVLPVLLTILTRKPRYLPDIQWSSKSWVHNIFRVYELIFWRKFGIRAESSSQPYIDEKGRWAVKVELYTFEAVCAHIETLIRKFFDIKWLDVKVEAFQFAIASGNGIGGVRIPWISFAIALDTSTAGTAATASPSTWTHTCTGSNLVLFVASEVTSGSGSTISTPTYNSVGMTLIDSKRTVGTLGLEALYYLLGPATGGNTVSAGFGGTSPHFQGASLSWSGVAQTGQPDASTGTGASTNNPSVTVTTIADNCWVVGFLGYSSAGATATAGLTSRQAINPSGSTKANLQDTNGPKTPAGNQTVNWTLSTINTWGINAASFSPAVSTVTVGEMMAAINLPTQQPIFEQIGVVGY